MKIKFIEAPKGRPYKIGEVVEFTGPIPEGYARKFIMRGWAVDHVDAPVEPAAPELKTERRDTRTVDGPKAPAKGARPT